MCGCVLLHKITHSFLSLFSLSLSLTLCHTHKTGRVEETHGDSRISSFFLRSRSRAHTHAHSHTYTKQVEWEGHTVTTKVKQDTVIPIWQETFELPFNRCVCVYDRD